MFHHRVTCYNSVIPGALVLLLALGWCGRLRWCLYAGLHQTTCTAVRLGLMHCQLHIRHVQHVAQPIPLLVGCVVLIRWHAWSPAAALLHTWICMSCCSELSLGAAYASRTARVLLPAQDSRTLFCKSIAQVARNAEAAHNNSSQQRPMQI
jgi:hypothetical protein